MSTEKSFLVNIITPKGKEASFECESLVVSISDGKRETEGGAYGIRKGHASALIALDSGRICAMLGAEKVFCARSEGGFARIEGGEVFLTVRGLEKEERAVN